MKKIIIVIVLFCEATCLNTHKEFINNITMIKRKYIFNKNISKKTIKSNIKIKTK